jgi:mannose-1-phosphate guanylyltransferase/phosphomannomutase
VKAIILAGGLGTRLRPLTTTCPKPLLPVGNLPILARIIFSLRKQDIRDFLFLLHYQPERFKCTLGNGEAYDAHFEYVEIDEDLGTAGSVKYIGDEIRETSLIYSADILAEVPVQRMLDFHHLKKALVTIALCPMPAPLAFGIVLRRSDGTIARFLEKPSWPQVFSDWINSAIYMIEPGLVEHIPNSGTFAMFEKDVFPPLAAKRAPIFGFPLFGYWRDVGTPEDLRLANIDFIHSNLPFAMLTPEEEEHMHLASDHNEGHGLWVGEDTQLAAEAHVHESVIGKECRIAAGARIARSVILDRVVVAAHAQLEGAIVMNDVRVGAGARVQEDCLIGAGAVLGENAVLHRNSVIRPLGCVHKGQIMKPQKILPTGYFRRFVDSGNLLGSPYENFNPRFLHWLGRAFASQQSSKYAGVPAILLATAHREAFAKSFNALAEGLAATGAGVHLLSGVSLPITRKKLLNAQYAGALYLGGEDFSGLLRVVLLHGTGENFSTLEACGLECTELLEGANHGEWRELEALQARKEYLDAMAGLLPKLVGPKRILLGVVGEATATIAQQFLEKFGLRGNILTLPQEATIDFKTRVDGFQQQLAQQYAAGFDFVFWMGSVGERVRLVLPGYEAADFGVSDVLLAQLLSKRWINSWPIVSGWLMPEIRPHPGSAPPADSPVPMLTGMNSSMAKMAEKCGYSRWYGFDGNGGITVSQWLNHHDALMALAHILPVVAEKNVHTLARSAGELSTRHDVLACPDEAKAQVMRRLIESLDDQECEVNDGVKIKSATGWVVVRLCAGRPALEVFKFSRRSKRQAEEEIEALSARVLRNLNEWIAAQKSS